MQRQQPAARGWNKNKKLMSKVTFLDSIEEDQKAAIRSVKQLTGVWEVRSTGKKAPSWQKYSKVLGSLNKGKDRRENRNFQAFDESGSFTNLSEYIGMNFFAYTQGTYEITDAKEGQIAASVSKIIVVLLGKQFEISVMGVGAIQVQYIDREKRVFKSEEEARVLQEKVDINTLPEEYRDILMVSGTDGSLAPSSIGSAYQKYRGYAFFSLPVILYAVAELGVIIRGD